MARKKPLKKFSAKEILANINRDVAVAANGRKMTLEEAHLRLLVSQALKDKKFSAIKHLLDVFAECNVIEDRQGGFVREVPKTWDFQHAARHFDNRIGGWPKGFVPKLSKIGIKELERRKTDLLALGNEEDRFMRESRAIYEKIDKLLEPPISTEDLQRLKEQDRDKYDKFIESEWKRQDAVDKQLERLQRDLNDCESAFRSEVGRINTKWNLKIRLSPAFNTASYGKPPAKHQFKKGTSGNPRGRPPAERNRKRMVQRLAAEEIEVIERGQPIKKPILILVLDALTAVALSGHTYASRYLRKFHESLDPSDKEKLGYLLVPAGVTMDEYMELLEEHRQKSEEDVKKLRFS